MPEPGRVPGTRNDAVITAVPDVAVVPVDIVIMGLEVLPVTHSHESGPIFGAVAGVGALSFKTNSLAAARELPMSKRT
jgi:hypothetical protein